MKKELNANTLKAIAITAMTLDHIAWMLFPGYSRDWLPIVLHIIGRITCPVMCFFIAEGYHHTKNIAKYTGRLFAFAFLSHFAYVFFSSGSVDWKSFIPFYDGNFLNQTSVMWPLSWGLVMLRIADSGKISPAAKPLLIILVCLITFPSDWSCIASLCVLAFGTNRGNFRAQMLWMVFYVSLYCVVYFFALDKVYGILQMAVVAAIPILSMYNGQRGGNPRMNRILKWLFYIYYPLHLLIIGWIQIAMLPQ
ncbi:MAG: conjugal transfer protein TraX [Oscillospiraceae bacterium]|nr:conjugal transfer protein TraX [Oscillospiraceae bacterium]